jgi:flagellar hook-basal body complex protein FliE
MIDSVVPSISPVGPSSAAAGADLARAAATATTTSEAASADLGAMLGQLAGNAASLLKTAEATSIAGMRGQASVQQVVDAVMSAEQTLQGAIAIRDKVVSAYLELSRMSI